MENLEGTLDELNVSDRTVEYVEIEWHEAFKKIHRKKTDSGREVRNTYGRLGFEAWIAGR